MPFIIEGIVTTRNPDRSVNVAPMGPLVDPEEPQITRLHLRPFQTSVTYANLARERCGVFHVIDDVLLLARAAVNRLDPPPEIFPAAEVDGAVLTDACRWYEFRITAVDDSRPRSEMQATVVHTGRLRDVTGFNRARHAVLEAAILASRVHLLDPDEIQTELARLQSPVEKTAGPREHEAFELLRRYIDAAPCGK